MRFIQGIYYSYILIIFVTSGVNSIKCSGKDISNSLIGKNTSRTFEFNSYYGRIEGSGGLDKSLSAKEDNNFCQWTINPLLDGNGFNNNTHISHTYYTNIYFETIVLSGGWLEIYEKSADKTQSIKFWQTSIQNLPTPIRIKSPTLILVWHGLGQGLSSVSFRFSYYISAKHLEVGHDKNAIPPKISFWLHYPWAHIESLDSSGTLPASSSFFYHIQPDLLGSSIGPITFMVAKINLPASRLIIYDGDTIDDPVLSEITGYEGGNNWIVTSRNTALLVLEKITGAQENNNSIMGRFELMYLADGDSFKCTYSKPIIFSGLSGRFTDGTSSTKQMRPSEDCHWRISTPVDDVVAKEIVLYFNRFDLKLSTNLLIYEGIGKDYQNLVWACRECTATVPPILKTFSGEFNIYLSSDGSDGTGRTGFEVEYYMDYDGASGPGDNSIHLLMSSAIVSPPGLGNSPTNEIVWYIQPFLKDNEQISVAFTVMNLSESCTTNISFFDGPSIQSRLLGTYCNSTIPQDWIISTGSSMTVQFLTISKPSHYIDVEFMYHTSANSYRCGYAEGSAPTVFKAPSMIISNGGAGQKTQTKMDSNLDCQWFIDIQDPEFESLSLLFAAMDLRGAIIRIYDASDKYGELLFECIDCVVAPEKIESTSRSMLIMLHTKDEKLDIGTGFQAQYYTQYQDGGNAMGNGNEVWGSPTALNFRPPKYRPNHNTFSASYFITIDSSLFRYLHSNVILVFVWLDIGYNDCSSDQLVIYDGNPTPKSKLMKLCGNFTPIDWIVSSGSKLTLEIKKFSNKKKFIDFHAQYTTEPIKRTLQNCFNGTSNSTVAILRSQSFLISSNSFQGHEIMKCDHIYRWIIEPSEKVKEIELIVDYIRLRNSILRVYDGNSIIKGGRSGDAYNLIWQCSGCSFIPPLLLAYNGSFTIELHHSSKYLHNGDESFKLYYRSTKEKLDNIMETTTSQKSLPNHTLLIMPVYTTESHNFLWRFHSPSYAGKERIVIGDIISSECDRLKDVKIIDGSQGNISNKLMNTRYSFCGTATDVNANILLKNQESHYTPQYHSSNPLPLYQETSNDKVNCAFSQIHGRYRWYKDKLLPLHNACHYLIDLKTQNETLIQLTISKLKLRKSSSLSVYAGRSRKASQLYFCGTYFAKDNEMQSHTNSNSDSRVVVSQYDEHCDHVNSTIQLNSTCGAIYIIHVYDIKPNQTMPNAGNDYNDYSGRPPSFEISYDWITYGNKLQPHEFCIDHVDWEYQEDHKMYFWRGIPFIIIISFPVLLLFCLVMIIWYACVISSRPQRLSRSRWWLKKFFAILKTTRLYDDDDEILHGKTETLSPSSPPAKHHVTYTPVRNKFIKHYKLKRGEECCVCFGNDEKSIRLIECKHEICVECLKNYVQTAIGDVSMLPLKCPMHHQGCRTILGANLVQLVLSRTDFHRFQMFLDKAVFGDGMSCIFCHSYVTFPEDNDDLEQSSFHDNSNVVCPYCQKRFCMKCQQPWYAHHDCGAAAATRKTEQLIETWRKIHNVTKCPGCFKPIEKDDPETCNHMVHKSTDSIPCTKERIDYCYCCGIEVARNHPHYEIVDGISTGIDHFPDGVFQDCRTLKQHGKKRSIRTIRSPNRRIVPI